MTPEGKGRVPRPSGQAHTVVRAPKPKHKPSPSPNPDPISTP